MKNKPKISVIIGVYNTPIDYVKKSLDSIFSQSYNDFEVILCNDGCTDNTFSYIEKEYGTNPKVKLIYNEKNMGLAYSLNHCLKNASGDYIARMDTDDFSHKDRFEKQIEILNNDLSIGLVNSNVNEFDDMHGIYGERKYNKIIQKKDFLKNNPIVHPVIMARKECFDKVNGYSEEEYTVRNEDYDIFMRMYAEGIKMYTIQEKLLDFREDLNAIKRRRYKFRINEAKVRFINYRRLKLLPIGIIYALKPLVVGLIPNKLVYLKNKSKIKNKKG